MCRILSYLGEPILTASLLYEPDNSFIRQSYHPRYMSHLLNLAGFGLVAWDTASRQAGTPWRYRTPQLPFYDENLKNLASKITPHCLLAHLRGVAYTASQVVSTQNVHPFMFPGTHIALAHNGALYEFEKMKYSLTEYIRPAYRGHIRGTTDSEWIYAVFLSQLPEVPGDSHKTEDIIHAIIETLRVLQKVRQKHNISINSPVNLFISNGEWIAATRFVMDYGWMPDEAPVSPHFVYHSLWYTCGERYGWHEGEYRMRGSTKKSSIIIASEPLTENTSTWVEVPEYSLMVARPGVAGIEIVSRDIAL